MAVVLAAVALSALLARSSAAKPCAGYFSMGMVVDIAPACFEACSILCSPMNDLVLKYFVTFDVARLKPLVCSRASKFDCFFANVDACGILREKAAGANIELPASSDAMQAECDELGYPTDLDDGTNSDDNRTADRYEASRNSSDDNRTATATTTAAPELERAAVTQTTSAALGVARLGAAQWAVLAMTLWLLGA